ncbi:NAD(P)/FAD-dependent oxidoreductase [Paraburkholderia domus]|uniref:NAD(P)/FAD-dependent oxidoreductase n=1 Tax=Paraburkholderia domus TaxID=2793075 RepID=UPI0019121DEE|nr:FAD-dependent oxidoreductase [Paraburkholderia domus]MBK5065916.1 FAD-dependent oxidoreductase [Burkholderia sp. R-70199]CAE6959427.1 Putidaredoxin reductase CamA [Paraburkholderia domus]
MSSRLVIVGGGQVAAQIIASVQQFGGKHAITLVSDELHLPYQRPPLSKAFFDIGFDPERLLFRDTSFYSKAGVDLKLGVRATHIDRAKATLLLSDGCELPYDQLVIATGARARKLDLPGAKHANVLSLRSLNDAMQLAEFMRPKGRMVIIGGGYVGLELAASARKRDMHAVLLEVADRLLSRVASPFMSEAMARIHRGNGVEIRTGARVAGFYGTGRAELVRLVDGTEVPADVVLVGVGAEPNDQLALGAGLDISSGIDVDEVGRTTDPRIFAAGDCTCTFVPRLNARMRFESVPHAIEQAKAVAMALCDRTPQRLPPPWFWSEQYENKLQMIGVQTGYTKSVVREPPGAENRAFTEFYLQGDELISGASLNRPQDFMGLRKALVTGPVTVDIAKLANPNLPLADVLMRRVPA